MFSLILFIAKALIHLGKRLWFFVCKGKGKRERTYVLKEVKEAFVSGLFHSHRWHGKREEGKDDGDHHIERSKEEREGRGEAVFQVGADGKVWSYENVLLENDGASGYIVYVRGTREEGEEQDTVTCYIPNLLALYDFLNYFIQGRTPSFRSIAEAKPLL